MNIIDFDRLVAVLEEKHGGGKVFFNELDSILLNQEFINFMYHHVYNKAVELKMNNLNVVCTGQFGEAFKASFYEHTIKQSYGNGPYCLCLPGGLGIGKPNFKNVYNFMYGEPFIFVDDSYYSGKTIAAAEAYLSKNHCSIIHNIVFYDGSPSNLHNVESFYRYHTELKLMRIT